MDGKAPEADGFVKYINTLSRGSRAKLRESLNWPPLGTWPEAIKYVEWFTHRTVPQGDAWARAMTYLTAGLQAISGVASGHGNFGEATRDFLRRNKSEAIASRFAVILNSKDESAITYHLRDMISWMSQYGVAPNWAELRKDLSRWHDPKRSVQMKWARAYYMHQVPKCATLLEGSDDYAEPTNNDVVEE